MEVWVCHEEKDPASQVLLFSLSIKMYFINYISKFVVNI